MSPIHARTSLLFLPKTCPSPALSAIVCNMLFFSTMSITAPHRLWLPATACSVYSQAPFLQPSPDYARSHTHTHGEENANSVKSVKPCYKIKVLLDPTPPPPPPKSGCRNRKTLSNAIDIEEKFCVLLHLLAIDSSFTLQNSLSNK